MAAWVTRKTKFYNTDTWIPVSVKVDRSGNGKAESANLRVDVPGEDDLTGKLVDAVGPAPEDVNSPLLVGAAVGRTRRQVVESVLESSFLKLLIIADAVPDR